VNARKQIQDLPNTLPSSWMRRLRVPLAAIGVPLTLFVPVAVLFRVEFLPEVYSPLLVLLLFTILIALLVLPIWFLFFSGFSPATKLIGILVAALLAGTFAAVLHYVLLRVEYTGQIMPVFVFCWEADRVGQFAERLDQLDPAARVTLAAEDLVIGHDDFPRYRGTRVDGVAGAVVVPQDWAESAPKEIWRTTVGWSYSGIAVAGNVAVTLEQRKDREAVVCYDRATGKELWSHSYPAEFKHSQPMGGGGPRSTPTIADADIYSLGALGDLVCLDGQTGKPRWSVNVVEDNGAKVVEWGMTSSPLIAGSLVVVNAGIDRADNRGQAVAAYDRKTGTKVWAAGNHPAGYSSPMLANLAGVEQIVLFDGGGVAGINSADGHELWRYPWKTFSDMNIIQPLILPGDRVFISSEATNGCALLQVKQAQSGWSAIPVWANRNLAARFANPVYHGGHIYGITNTYLCCLDAQTGRRTWSGETFDSGQLLLAGGTLLVQAERTGELVAVVADPLAYRELGRVQVFQGGRTWNTPALAGGRLYLRNHEEMVSLELARLPSRK
jgi:outer membrane protein assembly factor BamB